MKAMPTSASWEDNATTYYVEYAKGLGKEFIEAHR